MKELLHTYFVHTFIALRFRLHRNLYLIGARTYIPKKICQSVIGYCKVCILHHLLHVYHRMLHKSTTFYIVLFCVDCLRVLPVHVRKGGRYINSERLMYLLQMYCIQHTYNGDYAIRCSAVHKNIRIHRKQY